MCNLRRYLLLFIGIIQGCNWLFPPVLPKISEISVTGYPISINIDSPYVYIGTQREGLKIVKIESPESPVIVSSFFKPDTIDTVREIKLYEGNLVIASSALSIIDVSNPIYPRIKAIYDTNARFGVHSIVLVDSFIYASVLIKGNPFINIYKVPSLELLRSLKEKSCARLVTDSNYLYLCWSGEHVDILDIRDRTNPIRCYEVSQDTYYFGEPYDVYADDAEIQDNYLFITDGWFSIIDVSDKAHPMVIYCDCRPWGDVVHFALTKEYVFLLARESIEIYNISRLPKVKHVDTEVLEETGTEMAIGKRYMYFCLLYTSPSPRD